MLCDSTGQRTGENERLHYVRLAALRSAQASTARQGPLVKDNKQAVAPLVTREIGKPYPVALGEVQEIVGTCD
jgi:hypothetical protein